MSYKITVQGRAVPNDDLRAVIDTEVRALRDRLAELTPEGGMAPTIRVISNVVDAKPGKVDRLDLGDEALEA